MELMRRVLAWLIGEGFCPSCDRPLTEVEAGHHECSCGVVVDYSRGGWSFRGEPKLRRLPGFAGTSWDKEAA